MKLPHDPSYLKNKFKKYELENHVLYNEGRLKIISPQPPIGEWLYIIFLIILPLAYLIYNIYQSGFVNSTDNYRAMGIVVCTLVIYFFLTHGNHNILIDYQQNKIYIFKKALLLQLIFFWPTIIPFDQVESLSIKKSYSGGRGSNRGHYNFKVFIHKKESSWKTLLIEFTDTETKINEDLATSLVSFLKGQMRSSKQ